MRERNKKAFKMAIPSSDMYNNKKSEANVVTHLVEKRGKLATPLPVDGSTAKVQYRVLLIEDSEEAAFLVEHALQEHGNGKYLLKWLSNLSDGLAWLSRRETDIVLLDLGLPETSGVTSYARLREAAPDVPVVVLSGDTAEETQISVIAGGVQDYLVKEKASGPLLVEAMRSAFFASRRR